jgi:cellobiose epimerase
MFTKNMVQSKLIRISFMLVMTTLLLAVHLPASAQTRSLPQPDMFLDVDWYRTNLIATIDKWNGGLDGESGMGAYDEDFSGFFHVNLDRQFRPYRMESTTAVAQSRGIYINVEAYRAAGAEDGQRFLDAAVKGTEFLLTTMRDPDYGGFYWEVAPSGDIVNDMKQGYGNVHPLLALAHVYDITREPIYLDAVLEQLEVIETRFLDPDYPGGILPGFNRTYTEIIGVKNIDTFTHLFETLLFVYDITEGETREHIADLIDLHGDYLAEHLYHDQVGFTDRGYVAYNYDNQWQPSQEPYTRETQWSGALQATTGHNIELAFLISRAVERGFDPEWLTIADKLIKFCTEYAIVPETGGMLYDLTDYDGHPLLDNPDNTQYIWWPQAETARALLHFTVVRGADYGNGFKKVETLFHVNLTDPIYGGLFYGLDAENNLQPVNIQGRGDVWKSGYHYAMYFAEVLRLSEQYPDQLAELDAALADQ